MIEKVLLEFLDSTFLQCAFPHSITSHYLEREWRRSTYSGTYGLIFLREYLIVGHTMTQIDFSLATLLELVSHLGNTDVLQQGINK